MIGRALSHYKVTAKLGEGAMGEVYLAQDTKLDREVALKILPEGVAEDPERLERFTREAKAIAALNHPSIVTIHSVEELESDGNGPLHLLTMERVEGKSLDKILPSGGFDLERLLSISAQIADALAAAHAKGITHRDLKPANVMVSDEGRVKILDFGLAKLAESERPEEEATQLLTQHGMILGTVPYMSPEQVQGQAVDHRSDIFSLGVMLHEMATGSRPFQGENAASIISSVLTHQPPAVTEVRVELPNHLGRIVRRCLEKQPHKRFQSARDVQLELEGLDRERSAGTLSSVVAAPAAAAAAKSPRPRWLVPAIAAFVLGALGTYVLTRGPSADAVSAPVVTSLSQITDFAGSQAFPSLSPDGRQIAYTATRGEQSDIHLLRIGGDNPINLTRGSGADDSHPAFSPNGESIVFRSGRQGGGLFLMGATGESVRRLTDFGFHPSWSPDGTKVVFSTDMINDPAMRATGAAVWIVDVESGEPRKVTDGDASQPVWSPNGQRIAYWGLFSASGQRDLWTIAVDGSDPVRLTDDPYLDWHPIWSPNGRYLYFVSDRGGSRNLWRLPMDARQAGATGPPEPVTAGAGYLDHPAIDASGGRLAFVSQFRRDRIDRFDFDPTREVISGNGETLVESSAMLGTAWLSSDDQKLLYWALKGQDSVMIEHLDRSERQVLIRDEFRNRTPHWCEQNRAVLFGSDRGGSYEIWSIDADGGNLRQLTFDTESLSGANVPVCVDGTNRFYFTEMGSGPAVAELENGDVSKRQQLPRLSEDSIVVFLDISSDRRFLTGTLWGEGAATAIVVYDIANEQYRKTDFDRPYSIPDTMLRWLSDSRRVGFVVGGEMKILDAVTMEIRDVGGTPNDSVALAGVSSDDRQVLIVRRSNNDDIWMLELDTVEP